ncbi:MAG: ribosomal protein L13e [Thermofilaceae archaeon]
MSSAQGPPPPIVKAPLLRQHGGVPPRRERVGKGYSEAEVKAVGLTVHEARLLGIYVDKRRKSLHEENVQRLASWLKALASGEVQLTTVKLPKVVTVKPDRGRVSKGKTMAGRKVRGLLSTKYRYTHNYKWARKQRERELKKRHEATRHKGGD